MSEPLVNPGPVAEYLSAVSDSIGHVENSLRMLKNMLKARTRDLPSLRFEAESIFAKTVSKLVCLIERDPFDL
jgi:hypothetical protein